MAAKRKFAFPTPESVENVWQRRATAAAIVALRDMIRDGTIPPATPVSRLSDIELGWLFATSLFAWIACRAEQAAINGWDVEATLRHTELDPEPWDAGAVAHILPQLGQLDFDWSKPITAWSKEAMIRFLLEAMKLIKAAMIARDAGGSIATRRKPLDEMQRVAAAEAGGPLMTPTEFNDLIGI